LSLAGRDDVEEGGWDDKDDPMKARRFTWLLAGLGMAALLLPAGAFGQSSMQDSSAGGNASSMMSTPIADSTTGHRLRLAASTGHKVIFTDLAAAEALAQAGPTVLFFAADWCPSCQADLRDINAHGARLQDITVVVVDYDKAVDLETRYAITAQDTFVQIDGAGKALTAWNGGGVDGILSHVMGGGA
jgi:hypothetical protein